MRLVVLNKLKNDEKANVVVNFNNKATKQQQSRYKENVVAEIGGSVELYCKLTDEPDLEWTKVDGVILIF